MNNPEEFIFKAEINELMNMIIHHFYSNKDIFLRELISNASDAINKLKHESIKDKTLLEDFYDFVIKIKIDKKLNTIMIEDTGIGMTKNDLINNLGTIAKSGTKEFIQKIYTSDKNTNLIGQFGVGFYSGFLIADNIKVVTRYANTPNIYEWESKGSGFFTLKELDISECDLIRGTRIYLNIKSDAEEYLNNLKIIDIIKKYSSYINYPILLCNIEDNSKKEYWEKINIEPLWSKSSSEITKKEYELFYKSISDDVNTYFYIKHFKMEGNIDFTSIIFFPALNPNILYDKKKKNNLKLYVKKVLIGTEEIIICPIWLNFITGIVDSNDLPLNVSRELLQESKIIKQISNIIIKKSIEMMEELTNDNEKYNIFYKNFSENIKLGIHHDEKNRNKLINLLRYTTTKDNMVSLSSYKNKMIKEQKKIYYILGESLEVIYKSPLLNKFKKYNIEVIYMYDEIDEFICQYLDEYENIKLVNIEFDKSEISEIKNNKLTVDELNTLCRKMLLILNIYIDKIIISDKIDLLPAIVINNNGLSSKMEKKMKEKGHPFMKDYYLNFKIMEINPTHPIIEKLHYLSINENKNTEFKNLVNFVYEGALLLNGYEIDVNTYLQNVYKYINYN
jgi:molecular chaperone HtpG